MSWNIKQPQRDTNTLNSEHNPNDTSMKERLSMGLCFSPNGRFIYITSAANIYQYDLLEDSLRYIHGLDTTYLPFTIHKCLFSSGSKDLHW
ncbi:MAG: hypothetical protein HWD58_09630 [Bacteroidota bacterium]|nr:MAG: hypothetical protein HWD58_09630 [Bacteroidota bacterium]